MDGGVTLDSDVAMAETWADVRVDKYPIPPVLLVMAVWIWVDVLPALADEANA